MYKIWLWIFLAIAIDFAHTSFPGTTLKTIVSQYWWTSVSTDHKPSVSWYVNCSYRDILITTLGLHTETNCRSFLSMKLFDLQSGTKRVHINWFCYFLWNKSWSFSTFTDQIGHMLWIYYYFKEVIFVAIGRWKTLVVIWVDTVWIKRLSMKMIVSFRVICCF